MRNRLVQRVNSFQADRHNWWLITATPNGVKIEADAPDAAAGRVTRLLPPHEASRLGIALFRLARAVDGDGGPGARGAKVSGTPYWTVQDFPGGIVPMLLGGGDSVMVLPPPVRTRGLMPEQAYELAAELLAAAVRAGHGAADAVPSSDSGPGLAVVVRQPVSTRPGAGAPSGRA